MSDQIEARRVDVDFPGAFTGTAGMRIVNDVVELAYFGRPARTTGGAGTIEGQPFVIVDARPSNLSRGFAVLIVERVLP